MKRIFASLLFVMVAGSFFIASAQKKTKFKSLNYLYSISGLKTVAGIHNREPNASPARWTNAIDSVTGKFPGLWSGDFLFQKENIARKMLEVLQKN